MVNLTLLSTMPDAGYSLKYVCKHELILDNRLNLSLQILPKLVQTLDLIQLFTSNELLSTNINHYKIPRYICIINSSEKL